MEADFRLVWKALTNAYDDGWKLVLVNLAWFVLSLPVITLPVTMAGLTYFTHEMVHGESVGWKDFFVGIRKYFWPSMRYLLLNLFIFFLLLFYFLNIGKILPGAASFILGLILVLFLIWLLFMPFVFALMVQQEKPSLRSGLRNGLVMWLKWPGVTIIAVMLVYFLVGISSIFLLPWCFITASLCSYLFAFIVMVKAEEPNNQPTPTKA